MIMFSNFNNIYIRKDKNDIHIINMIYELFDTLRLFRYEKQSLKLQEKLNSTLKIMSVRYNDSHSKKTKYYLTNVENVFGSLF